MENLSQSQIRTCANEPVVWVTVMLSLRGHLVTINAPVTSPLLQALLGRPRDSTFRSDLVSENFVFFAMWNANASSEN